MPPISDLRSVLFFLSLPGHIYLGHWRISDSRLGTVQGRGDCHPLMEWQCAMESCRCPAITFFLFSFLFFSFFIFFFCSTLTSAFIGFPVGFPLQELTGVRCGHFRVFMGSFPGQHLDTRLVLCVLHFSTWWSCLAFSFSSPYTWTTPNL